MGPGVYVTLAPNLWEKLGYKPHPKQLLFHESPARFKVPACGRRFGKSEMAAKEVEPYLFTPTFPEYNRKGPGLGWIVAPTYDTADEFQYLWQDMIVRLQLEKTKAVKSCANNVRTGEMFIQFAWGDRVVVKSADKPTSLVGKGLKWLVVSEAAKLPEIIWQKYLSPAMADFKGPALFPSTPEGFNWYKVLHDMGRSSRAQHTEWASWNFPSWENPYVYPGGFDDPEVQRQLRTPDDPWFWQEIGASFRSVAGLVYREWDQEVHVKPVEYRPEWENYLAFDFGYSNPFVALDIMVSPSEDVYIWREYYWRQKPVHIHARELAARQSPEGYHINCGYGDSADPDAVDTLGRMLTPVVALDDAKDVGRGIREVSKFLRSDQGVPRLFVDPSCVNTIEEFNQYKMAKPRSIKVDDNPKDEPHKAMDHAMDALRYFIMHRFVLGADSHLESVVTREQEPNERGIFVWGDEERVTL